MKRLLSIIFLLLYTGLLHAQDTALFERIAGAALLHNTSYDMLMRLCDEAGGRWTGSAQNESAMDILIEELRQQGLQPHKETFSVPGWKRGEDAVSMIAPSDHRFRAVALGYVNATPEFVADLRWADRGYSADFDTVNVKGCVVLLTQETLSGAEELLRSEAIVNAAKAGARAVLFINNKKGGKTLSGMTNFQGTPAPIPAFSLTWEEGQRLLRLLRRNVPVRMRIKTESRCLPITSANIVCTLPGRRSEKIVIGAHFDSWDVGQGAIDNGVGTAILFDIARVFQSITPENERTIEFVWFNGEEMGLWGSRRYVEQHRDEPIAVMINMDMPGSPRGFNALGNDHLLPLLHRVHARLGGFDLSRGVVNRPWTNSDHQSFMLAGIPVITPMGYLTKEMVEPYHDFGDSFDLVSKQFLSDAVAVVACLAYELANTNDVLMLRRSPSETRDWLMKHGLDGRLKKQGEWIFD